MTVLVISFPFPAEQLSLNDRTHWRTKAKLTASWREAARVHAQTQTTDRLIGPATVQVTFTGIMVRDAPNLAATIKPVIDGMVDASIWLDDDDSQVTLLPTIVHRGRRPVQDRTITVTITTTRVDP